MHLNYKPAILVPVEHRREIERMSKAALMDLVWDLASVSVDSADDADQVISKIREHRAIVLHHRGDHA